MKNLYTRIRDLKFPLRIKQALSTFSKREWYVFLILVSVMLISTIGMLGRINKSFMTEVPATGGSVTIGIVGTPRFINPVLASSDADRDLTSIIYSGLLRKNSNGDLISDLSDRYEISEDELTYTFTLKDNIYFHNGQQVTADDVVFTINAIKNPDSKSPYKGTWDAVVVEKVDEKTVKFILKQPYESFLHTTTVGIMPAKLWENAPLELNDANINPVGTGPYKTSKVSKESSGIINEYELKSFKKFNLGAPYISKMNLKFYANEDESVQALLSGAVEQIGYISPENALKIEERGYEINSSVLPRVFGLFFNQSQNTIFTNKNVVRAIETAINKERIVNDVLLGYGVAIDSPIPPSMLSSKNLEASEDQDLEDDLAKAEEILSKDGWVKNEDGFLEKNTGSGTSSTKTLLEFSISTGNAPELAQTAQIIKENLELIGIKVDVKTFEIGNLNQMVIRPRKYDALLFGQIINHESDLSAFWHSSQRKDPGLNVALYANTKVDQLLEEAAITSNEEERSEKYSLFEKEIKKDLPAIFLYSPSYIYVNSEKIKNKADASNVSARDRFLDSYMWYTKTSNVWKIFAKE